MSKTSNKTFRLSQEATQALEALVRAGKARSQTALLEALIAREKKRLDMEHQEQELEAAWEAAMASPEYPAELLEIEESFAGADAESARGIN